MPFNANMRLPTPASNAALNGGRTIYQRHATRKRALGVLNAPAVWEFIARKVFGYRNKRVYISNSVSL